MHYSEGGYIDGGSTSDTEWKRVVIPMADFVKDPEEWPNLDGVKDMYFRTCGTAYSVSPRYHVRDLFLTDNPPSIDPNSTEESSTPAPTSIPTGVPTTAAPTKAPTASPTLPEEELSTDTYIYQNVEDGYAQLTTSNASEKEGTPCTAGRTVR